MPRTGDEIQPFRGAACEDEAVGIANAEKLGDPQTRLVVALGRPHGKRVRAAMWVCVRRIVEISQRIEHDLWLLRCRCRIEVVQARIVDEQRKIRPKPQVRMKL